MPNIQKYTPKLL